MGLGFRTDPGCKLCSPDSKSKLFLYHITRSPGQFLPHWDGDRGTACSPNSTEVPEELPRPLQGTFKLLPGHLTGHKISSHFLQKCETE